ncbi:MAG: HAD-IIIA family hydrolase [Candidatus Omnitrophota bacterium]|nr:HAD-IIIA family hydrolase [Candidatus Omnitrophota bacterium]MDZ4241854.1 HAD-IIIA family hydrolase [Candidatus Omnitrophota bacterium]
MKVVFLDRDGVINEFPGNGNYVTKVKDFRFIPGALKALRRLTDAGFMIFVVSNQAGVGKGVYSLNKLRRITENMLRDVRKAGGRIKKVYYCTHRSDQNCDCRKPRIGSIRKAMGLMSKSLRSAQKAFFVGDTKVDILAGHNAGCTTIFVRSGRKEDQRNLRTWRVRPDFIARDLLEASDIIAGQLDRKPARKKSAA